VLTRVHEQDRDAMRRHVLHIFPVVRNFLAGIEIRHDNRIQGLQPYLGQIPQMHIRDTQRLEQCSGLPRQIEQADTFSAQRRR
jgi:hypothetical protein